MSKFADLIQNPFGLRSYLVTAQPYAIIHAEMSVSGDGIFTAEPGTFSGLLAGDVIQLSGCAQPANQGAVTVASVSIDGAAFAGTGLAFCAEHAPDAVFQGLVTRYFSDNGFVSGPEDVPAHTWFNPVLDTPLNFSRSMYGGAAIGGASIPDHGEIKLINLDGSLDPMRLWGWAARSVRVLMGGKDFALSDYGVIFAGLAVAIDLDDRYMTLHLRALSDYFGSRIWTSSHRGGNSGYDGPDNLAGRPKPLTLGRCRNVPLTALGLVNGYWAYQFNDGQSGLYDPSFHRVLIGGVPLAYAAGLSPAAGQWCLDDTAGVILVGASPAHDISADVIGDNPRAAYSTTSASIGIQTICLLTDGAVTFVPGQSARIQRLSDPAIWMLGQVITFAGGAVTIAVSATAGTGTFNDWRIIPQAAACDLGAMIVQVAQTRVQLDSGMSTSTLTVGLGLVTLAVSPSSLPFGVGGLVRISSRLYPESQWMLGQVTAWTTATGSMSVLVTRYMGSGLGSDWRVTKLGFLDSEIDLAAIQAVSHAQPGPAGYFINEPASAAEVFDALANSAALWYGFNRAGQFGLGQLVAPTGAAVLSLDESQILDLRRQASRPPVWSLLGRYQRNWAPLQLSQLAAQVLTNAVINGRFDSDTTWSKGTGWNIGVGVASASPGVASDISQSLTLDPGQAYVLAGQITAQSGALQPKLDSVAMGGALTATGVVRQVFTATTALPVLSFSKSAGFMGTLDNISVTVRDLSFMNEDWRWVTDTDPRAREIYGPSAIEETLTLYFDQQSDAQAEVSRQLSLLSSMRDVFEVIAKVQPFITDIGQVVTLTASRFGLKKGRKFIVLALDEDASANTIRLTLWG